LKQTTTEEPDWELIRWLWENSKTTKKQLANEFCTYDMAISRKARAENWRQFDPIVAANIKREEYTVINPEGILGKTAVRKIQEIVEELGDEYSPVDEPLVISYAESYERYLKLVAIVNKEGETSVSPKTGAVYTNPYFSALQSVKSDMAKLGDKLGLSISSRRRLRIKLNKKDNSKSLYNLVNEIADIEIDI